MWSRVQTERYTAASGWCWWRQNTWCKHTAQENTALVIASKDTGLHASKDTGLHASKDTGLHASKDTGLQVNDNGREIINIFKLQTC
jgi:hypothetical protein